MGLYGPLLRSVLRGGIACGRGLEHESLRPEIAWMLSLEPFSYWSPSPRITCSRQVDAPRIRYALCLRSFAGSYSSCVFQSASTIDASRRARVSLAKFGFVP